MLYFLEVSNSKNCHLSLIIMILYTEKEILNSNGEILRIDRMFYDQIVGESSIIKQLIKHLQIVNR